MPINNHSDSTPPLPEELRVGLAPAPGTLAPAGVGAATAIELALRRAQANAATTIPVDQLPLLEVKHADDAEDGQGDPGATGPRVRGGRPKGARNKRTAAWVEFLEQRYRSPLIVLAEAWSRPADVLAAELGCTKVEAYALQQQAAIQSLPYWHQKQPLAMQIDGKGVVQLILEAPGSPTKQAETGASDLVLEARVISEEKQPLSNPQSEGVGRS